MLCFSSLFWDMALSGCGQKEVRHITYATHRGGVVYKHRRYQVNPPYLPWYLVVERLYAESALE